MRCTKVLLSLNENKHTQNLSQITIQIFENFVDMGLRNENYFDDFLSNLQMNEDIYFLALQCTLWKPILFLKCKPCDICTNFINKHVGLLWEANTNAQYILNPYATTIYYTSSLTKVNKSRTKKCINFRKMQTWTNRSI